MPNRDRSRLPPAATLLALAFACARAPAPPAPRPAGANALPPIPARTGALRIDVVAPASGETLPVRDSTFVYGSVGTGQATLTVNGAAVPVQPNGSFLAFLPVPTNGLYHLEATAAGQTAKQDVRVKLPAGPTSLPAGRATILGGTISPRGAWAALPGERIEVSFRGTPGGRATLLLPGGERVPMVESGVVEEASAGNQTFGQVGSLGGRAVAGVSTYRGFFAARPLLSADTSVGRPRLVPVVLPPPPAAAPPASEAAAQPRRSGAAGSSTAARGPAAADVNAATIEFVVGTDTARAPLPLTLAIVDRPRVALAKPPGAGQTTRDVVVARPRPGGPYTWFFPSGTPLTLTGERPGYYRVALTRDLSVWVSPAEVTLLPAGTPPPESRVGTVRFDPQPGWVDVRFALSERLPYKVNESGNTISVDLYGGSSDTDYMQYGPLDPLIREAEWSQPQDSIYRLRVDLTRKVWGYEAFFAGNGDFVLRIRRPPTIDPEHPLRGIRIAVDPGHPPGGAVGPTRLTEAEANLAIALELRDLLRQQGAHVIMTRTTNVAVPLNQRPIIAADSGADILLSVHNNGLPEGVNPFVNTGTSDYYFWPQSVDLAQELDRALVKELGLKDLGVGRADLALVRETWMPAVLTETMFLMVPQQEAALRNPAVQERIARAHVAGLEAFLRGRAAP